MAVNKHKTWPGWWVIDYYPEGRHGPRQRENFQGTEDEAMRYEQKLRGLHVSQAKTATNPPFKDIAAEFVKWANTNRSESYQKQIGWNLDQLKPHFGLFPPSRITDPLIEQYKEKRKATPRACNQELEMLNIIINWGADTRRNYCSRLPFRIEKLQVFKNLPLPPEPTEFVKLVEKIKANFKQARQNSTEQINKLAMVMIMYENGLRWIEVRHIEWPNLRLSDGRLYLGRTKTGRARFTYLSAEVLELIKPIIKNEGPVFINPRTGEIYKSMGKGLRSCAKAIGVRLKGTHTLRHALGTDSVDATGDIRGTQELLGHTEIRSTTVYTHTATKRLKRLLSDVQEYRKAELGKGKVALKK